MPNSIKKLEEAFKEGKYDQLLKDIYVDESVLAYQQERYIKALESFEKSIVLQEEVKLEETIQIISLEKFLQLPLTWMRSQSLQKEMTM
mgnify:CR=1 FL=1